MDNQWNENNWIHIICMFILMLKRIFSCSVNKKKAKRREAEKKAKEIDVTLIMKIDSLTFDCYIHSSLYYCHHLPLSTFIFPFRIYFDLNFPCDWFQSCQYSNGRCREKKSLFLDIFFISPLMIRYLL